MEHTIHPIAIMRSDFPSKFGIPRQSGLVESLRSTIVFEPRYRNSEALRGLEGFSHLWIIWQFSEAIRTEFTPSVRPGLAETPAWVYLPPAHLSGQIPWVYPV